MALKDDLTTEVAYIFTQHWTTQVTAGVPDPDDLRLDNHAKDLEQATVLYADIDGSTSMVDEKTWTFSAEIYKAYLRCSAKIITSEGGLITAYDGDRIMGIFTGNAKNTSAVRAAMKINHAVLLVINPLLLTHYANTHFLLHHKIGIDTSQLRAARIGIRGSNDLVWIGRAANYAAKLTSIKGEIPIWITKAIYDDMNECVHKSVSGASPWSRYLWTEMNNIEVYGTSHFWSELP